jgi:hypothetical protein
MPDSVPSTTKAPSSMVLRILAIAIFSLASWFGWDLAFQAADGMCVGPICVQQDTTTEGEPAIEHG